MASSTGLGADASVLEQLRQEATLQTGFLKSIEESQKKMAENQALQTQAFEQLVKDQEWGLWYQSHTLENQKNMEHRQNLTTPDGNDAWRHADQVCAGELWYGGDQLWAVLATQVHLRVTSKGQLPAECDLRRGQWWAVHRVLQFHGKLCAAKVQGWGPESTSGAED